MKQLTLVIAVLVALCAPAAAKPLTLATHYTPAQLAAFCNAVGGLFTPGPHYQCASACTSRGDGCDVICGDNTCVGTAPVRFSAAATPFQVLKTHVGGLLPRDPGDNWIVYDKKDPKPKPPPPTTVLKGLDGVEGESQDDKHKGEIHVESFATGGGTSGIDGESKDDKHKDEIEQPPPKKSYTPPKTTPPKDHSPSTGGSSGGAAGGFKSGVGGLKVGH